MLSFYVKYLNLTNYILNICFLKSDQVALNNTHKMSENNKHPCKSINCTNWKRTIFSIKVPYV